MDELKREIHPLLSPEDVTLLDKLAGSTDPELVQLRDLAWRLSKLKMHEGVFPKYVALIDHCAKSAFAIGLADKLPVGRSRLIWDGGKTPTEHCQLIEATLECPTSDAFLLARPCIRIADSVPLKTRERVADLAHLCVTVSNLPIRNADHTQVFHTPLERSEIHHHIWQGPILDFLADERGYGVQRQPTVLSAPHTPITGLFGTGHLDDRHGAHPHDMGVFLASGTVVSIDINYPILADEIVTLDTGLVMARYTTSGGGSILPGVF